MARQLADAVQLTPSEHSGAVTERVRWVEFYTDKERFSEFCEATDPSGSYESNSSSGHKDYQDRLRTIALRAEGWEKAEIAATLGRSSAFVQTWWRKDPKEVPKPPGVHEYLKAEFWRDIEIVRGFGKGLGIYEEVVPAMEWVQPMANGREFRGGGSRLKYDKEGRMRPQGNQNAKDGLVPGRLPKLDGLAQRLLVEKGIDDRVLKRPGILWYPDGEAAAIEHRHEAWTALMSFGAPRILLIDRQPILLRDGDLILFGTQRHGVPKMHTEDLHSFDEHGGRISVVFFFMPTGQQAAGAEPWRAITDGPSRKAAAMLRDADLATTSQVQSLQTGVKAAEIATLTGLGFAAEDAAAALVAAGFDLERAAEVLLSGGVPDRRQQLRERLAELQCEASFSGLDDDEALAKRLEEEMVVLEQLQELEQEQDHAGDFSLQSQFAAYEEMLDAEDAAEWDGRGDLMVHEWRRAHLNIEQQDPVTLYSFGCGSLREQGLFELLSLHSIRVLYDFRADPSTAHLSVRALELACKTRGLVYRHIALGRETAYGILKHLREDEGRNALAELVWHAQRKRSAFLGAEEDWQHDHRLAIAARLQQVGHKVLHVLSEGATQEQPVDVVMPEHIAGEEARLRTLEKQRVAGEAQRPTKSAVSRSTEHVAQRLTQPRKEIDVNAELRKANTQAELCRVQRRMADLQRKAEDSSDIKAGLGPKLSNVNKWVAAEAAQQREHLAAGKTKDGKEKGKLSDSTAHAWLGSGGTDGGNPLFGAAAASSSSCDAMTAAESVASTNPDFGASSASHALMVECRACGLVLPWDVLQEGDGCCTQCLEASVAGAVVEDMGEPRTDAASAKAKDAGEPGASAAAAKAQDVGELGPSAAAGAKAEDVGEPPQRSTWRSRRRQQRAALDV